LNEKNDILKDKSILLALFTPQTPHIICWEKDGTSTVKINLMAWYASVSAPAAVSIFRLKENLNWMQLIIQRRWEMGLPFSSASGAHKFSTNIEATSKF